MHLCKLEAASQDMDEAPFYNSSDGLPNEYTATANGIYSSAELNTGAGDAACQLFLALYVIG
jgi:hypothetical protein